VVVGAENSYFTFMSILVEPAAAWSFSLLTSFSSSSSSCSSSLATFSCSSINCSSLLLLPLLGITTTGLPTVAARSSL